MRRTSPLLALFCLAAVLPLSGCQKIQARMEMKKGNSAYKLEKYPDALEFFQRGLELDPDATFAYRSVGLTAMAMYKPGKDDPENAKMADLAITSFQKYLADYPEAPKVLDYLVGTYINAKRLEDGVAFVQQFATEHPENVKIHEAIVTMLTKVGRVPDALQWANDHEGARENPTVYYTIGVNAWDKSYNDIQMSLEQRCLAVDTGLAAMERALQLKRDFQSLVYYNLLYREKAKCFEADPVKKQEYMDLANKYAKEAAELRKEEERLKAEAEKKAGLGTGEVKPQPPIPGTEEPADPNAPAAAADPNAPAPAADPNAPVAAADPNAPAAAELPPEQSATPQH